MVQSTVVECIAELFSTLLSKVDELCFNVMNNDLVMCLPYTVVRMVLVVVHT